MIPNTVSHWPVAWFTSLCCAFTLLAMDRAPNVAIAAEIRAEMGRQRISGRELARRIGKPETTVARWLRGRTPMSLAEIDALAEALHIKTVELVERALTADPPAKAAAGGGDSEGELPRPDSNWEPAGSLALARRVASPFTDAAVRVNRWAA